MGKKRVYIISYKGIEVAFDGISPVAIRHRDQIFSPTGSLIDSGTDIGLFCSKIGYDSYKSPIVRPEQRKFVEEFRSRYISLRLPKKKQKTPKRILSEEEKLQAKILEKILGVSGVFTKRSGPRVLYGIKDKNQRESFAIFANGRFIPYSPRPEECGIGTMARNRWATKILQKYYDKEENLIKASLS